MLLWKTKKERDLFKMLIEKSLISNGEFNFEIHVNCKQK